MSYHPLLALFVDRASRDGAPLSLYVLALLSALAVEPPSVHAQQHEVRGETKPSVMAGDLQHQRSPASDSSAAKTRSVERVAPRSSGASTSVRDDAARLSVAYTADMISNVAGGVDTGVRYLGNLDVQLEVALSEYIGGSGLTLFAYGLGNQGGHPSELVGDLQVTSNIEAPMAWRLYELWVQQEMGERASVRAGLYDVNSEFDVNETGSLFLNSSHGIGAAFASSGVYGPSIFPATSLGVRVDVSPVQYTTIRAAVLDAVPDRPDNRRGPRVRLSEGALNVIEIASHVPQWGLTTKSGAWGYTRPFPELPTTNRGSEPTSSRGSWGAYGLIEGRLWTEAGSVPGQPEGLRAFVRGGLAEAEYNRIARYLGAGITYDGLLPGRSQDAAGLAVAAAFNGDPYIAAQERAGMDVTRAEVNVEGTYALEATEWLAIQADLQVVFNPNMQPDLNTAIVPGLRVTLSN